MQHRIQLLTLLLMAVKSKSKQTTFQRKVKGIPVSPKKNLSKSRSVTVDVRGHLVEEAECLEMV